MRECSVCNRLFDDGFSVFAPPCEEAFDRIECARRAAAVWAADERLAPILLPTDEALRPHSEPRPALVGRRLSIVALAVSALVPAQAAAARRWRCVAYGRNRCIGLPRREAGSRRGGIEASSADAILHRIEGNFAADSSQIRCHRLGRFLAQKCTSQPGSHAGSAPRQSRQGRAAAADLGRSRRNSRQTAVAYGTGRACCSTAADSELDRATDCRTHDQAESRSRLPKPKPADAQKPRDIEKPRHTQKPKHSQKPTDSQKPKDSNKPRDSHKPRDRPTNTAKPNPSATKTPTVEHPSPPNRQAAPPSAPESQPPTTAPSTNSEAPPHGPPDGQPGPPDQNGSHGEGNGNGNHGGGGHGH